MQTTVKAILEAAQGMTTIMRKSGLPGKLNYRLMKLRRKLDDPVKDYDETAKGLREKFATDEMKDGKPTGQKIILGVNIDAFNKEHQDILDSPEDVDCEKIVWEGKECPTAEEMYLTEPFIDYEKVE